MFLSLWVWPLILLLHHATYHLQQAIFLTCFPLGPLSYSSRQTCITQACRWAISAEHIEAVRTWGNRAELQSLPWWILSGSACAVGWGFKQQTWKNRNKQELGSGELYRTGYRKLRLILLVFWKAISGPDSISYLEPKVYVTPLSLYSLLCTGITSLDALSKAVFKSCLDCIGGQHAFCMASICSLSAVKSGNKSDLMACGYLWSQNNASLHVHNPNIHTLRYQQNHKR